MDLIFKRKISFIILLIIATIIADITDGQRTREPEKPLLRAPHGKRKHPCEQSSCYPATGNLLIGRKHKLSASSTCGLHGHEKYCIVTHLKDRKKCFFCQASNPLRQHNITNIVSGPHKTTWWQSENGVENVTIRFDLEAEFHFTHLIIRFQTFRPAAMLIERSHDEGKTWQVYRYFAHDCERSFPGISTEQPKKLTDVICESRYSNVAPSSGGEIIFRVLPPNLQSVIDNPYSVEVQNLMKMTNMRINFTKLHTLGDDLLDDRAEIREKYYYAIQDVVIRGSCSCYGHASACLELPGVLNEEEMVHGRCECTHNTKGLNCGQCQDLYNDGPWKPAVGKQTNACRKCNCNEHALSCVFNETIYIKSGKVSGGICTNCMHNTMGHNCEQCIPYYYHDETKNITNPDVCIECNCDPNGSLDNGICDSHTNPLTGKISGRCHCKANVEGRRCDRCKNGYWNFDPNNPDGCQPCTCNKFGTINNYGCDQITGECTCKRYVTARDCDQCLPEYWGLSDDHDGCKPCDCDLGGSYETTCDVVTGQCKCRPHLDTRTCKSPEQSYYTGSLDFLIYEGELAKSTDNCQVIIREPYRDGRNSTWTGMGFIKAPEKSIINFSIDNIKKSMWYDIIIRYEPLQPGIWQNIEIIIERNEPIDKNGPCSDWQPNDDKLWIELPDNARSAVVKPPICLENNKLYKITLIFKRYDNNIETPTASILVDSIILRPRYQDIPFFSGSEPGELRRQEFERYGCNDLYNSVIQYNNNNNQQNEICDKYLNSIGSWVFDGAYSCDCNPTGSHSLLCDQYGGTCSCKTNVIGRKCDRCAPGTYGFGPNGCIVCDCDGAGALDKLCDADTGRCKCRQNAYGRTCGQCEPGFWNFPNCIRCECNGHADNCDSKTGACISCRDSTTGHNCDRCIDTYYGDPRIGVDIPCRSCPCPGTIDSGHSYARSCLLDSITHDVICECDEGYSGARCENCAENYFGNPYDINGSCQLCNCNNNTDLLKDGNCDSNTGRCLQCLYDTDGTNCQLCKPGYYGNALEKNCQDCMCDPLGTDPLAGPCNNIDGQCPCLPHVIGKLCDKCEDNHWRIASNQGCDPCNCDPIGSKSDDCNPFTGSCECHEGFGGTRCNECQTNYWGDPNIKCQPCDCNDIGSSSSQCDRNTGHCICHDGIGGEKCDQCDRGYIGTAPSCTPCGECFDNWDLTLDGLKNHTNQVINEALRIQKVGTTGVYSEQFDLMSKSLNQIKEIIDNTTVKSQDLDNINNLESQLSIKSNNLEESLDKVTNQLDNVIARVNIGDVALNQLKIKKNNLHDNVTALKENALRLQEANVQGALNVTHQMAEQSKLAEKMANETKNVLFDAERYRKNIEILLAKSNTLVNEEQEKSKNSVDKLNEELSILENEIPEFNLKMCGEKANDCSNICGGAGCDFCGGISCDAGAVTKASQALDVAKKQTKKIKNYKDNAENLLNKMIQLKQDATIAHLNAQDAFNLTQDVINKTDKIIKTSNDLTDKITNFFEEEQATPSMVRYRAESVLNKNIHLKPDEIRNLADKIGNIVVSLTDSNKIITDTAPDLQMANNLEESANRAKEFALDKQSQVEKVLSILNDTQNAQIKTTIAIENTKNNIELSEKNLDDINKITNEAQMKAGNTTIAVDELETKLKQLQTQSGQKNFILNEEIKKELSTLADEAQKIKDKSDKLGTEYKTASDTLNERVNKSKGVIERAKNLLQRASELTADTSTKFKDLEGMESVYSDNDILLNSLMTDVDKLNEQMDNYLKDIDVKSQTYRGCSA